MGKPDPKRVAARYRLKIAQPDPLYPDIGEKAPVGVQMAIEEWKTKPYEYKVSRPLWFHLLGTPTPNYKLPPEAVHYTEPSPIPDQTCGNCEYAYQHVVTGDYICSVMRGQIEPEAWCRLWEAPDPASPSGIPV
jgi:hypothetical protein